MSNINNADSYASIAGTTGADNIYNDITGSYSTILGGTGDDSIDNFAVHVLINGGDGDDGIYNKGKTFVTVDGGADDDEITNYGSLALLQGGNGSDYINSASGNHITIDGGNGNDSIVSNSQRVSINGGAGNDTIYITGNSTTITGGEGDDLIVGSPRFVDLFQYSTDEGNDTIANYQTNDSLQILNGTISTASVSGNDFIIFIGNGSLTLQDAVNKRIKLIDNNKKIVFLNPGDYIRTNIDEASITGSDVPDVINNGYEIGGYNNGNNASIYAAGGNDTINNKGNNVYIDAGTGNDRINNFGSDTTIIAADGDDYVRTKGSYVSVDGGSGNDYIYNNISSHYSSITGGTGNDSIYNYGNHVIINGNDDDDYIYNTSRGTNSTLNGGNGNDRIRNVTADNVLINAGAGNDSIYTSGNNVTINGGLGDDTVRCSTTGNNLINYASGDGNDVIYGCKVNDTINITSGNIEFLGFNGTDVIFTVGDNYLTVKNGRRHYITIADSNGSVTSEFYDYEFERGITPNSNKTQITVDSSFAGDTIDLSSYPDVKNVNASLVSDTGIALIGNNRANVFYAGSGGSTMNGGLANDVLYCGEGADTFIYSKGDGNDTIYKYQSGQDTIQLSSDVTVSNVAVRGRTVYMYFEEGGSIKIGNAKGKAITIVDGNGETGTYTYTKNINGLIDTDTTAVAANYMERNYLINEEDEILNLELNEILPVSNSELNISNAEENNSVLESKFDFNYELRIPHSELNKRGDINGK